MPLPELWVDHLFAKLSVRWGAAFMRQWPDTDPALVKADWSEVLDGCGGDSIAYALRYLLIGFAAASLLSLWFPSSMVSALILVWVGMVIGLGSALIHFALDSAMDCITKDKP